MPIHLINNGQINDALKALLVQIARHPDENFLERLSALDREFDMMKEYFVKGVNDPKRSELYRTMKGKLLNLAYDVKVCEDLREMPMVKPYMSKARQLDRSVTALLTAPPDLAFYAVLASYHWRHEDVEDWVKAYTGDAPITSMHYILLGALTLSAMQHFSKQKAICLARIYNGAKEEEIRQRAFVGCLLSMTMDRDMEYNKKRAEVLEVLYSNGEEATRSMIELQMQLIRCKQASNDSLVMSHDIMPEIMKNQPFIITKNGIVERDEDGNDTYEDAEQRIEAMENSISKVQKLHQQGADIFFSGFKTMKRYAFFYKTSNWFVPFDINHPDIADVVDKLKGSKFLERVLEKGPFCSSDKYSFVYILADTIPTVSDKVRNMMEEGEVGPIGMTDDAAELKSPAYIRRQYLQDLFRFYSINTLGQALTNPFKDAEDFEAWLISLDHVTPKQLQEMGRYLIKKKYLGTLEDVINCYPDQDCIELDFLSGELLLREEVYGEAVDYYNSYLQEHPNHAPSLRGMAKAYYSSGDYGKASFYYDALRTLQPDRISYSLNYSMAMAKDGKAGEVLNELYKLNFEHPDNHAISNTLGWALLYAEKPDKALAVYEKIPEEIISSDLSIYLNYVYAHLLTKFRLPELKVKHTDGSPSTETLIEEMHADEEMLKMYGIGEAEITLMAHSL